MDGVDESDDVGRDDGMGPEAISRITDRLFLSGRPAATNGDHLRKIGITNVLTIDTFPLSTANFPSLVGLDMLFIRKDDNLEADILSEIDRAHNFIDSAVGATLVHCFVGMSRSASIVISYVMKSQDLSFDEAFRFVRARRSCVGPNDSFVSQLKLYGEMGCRIDSTNERYKQFRTSQVARTVLDCVGFENVDEETRKMLECQEEEPCDVTCRVCRSALARSSTLRVHRGGEVLTWWSAYNREKEEERRAECKNGFFFLPSMPLVQKLRGIQGKVYCPRCGNKVGSFSWLKVSCDCRAEMSPAVLLSASKIDMPLSIRTDGQE